MDFILLVDDSKVARMLISRGVAEAMPGLEIVEAVHAEDAIEKLTERGQAPKLTVIDYNMPGMTGLEFAGWMDTNWPGAPKVLCTANIQDSLVQRAAEVGVSVLPKPFSISKLREVVGLPAA